jgi:hypothetical protein
LAWRVRVMERFEADPGAMFRQKLLEDAEATAHIKHRLHARGGKMGGDVGMDVIAVLLQSMVGHVIANRPAGRVGVVVVKGTTLVARAGLQWFANPGQAFLCRFWQDRVKT